MRKNLISLSMLDKMGYKLVGEGGVLNVVKGALVVMKAKLSNDLYYLQGFLSKGYASVVSTEDTGSSSNSSNLLKLWHLRLGHMSYRGIEELNK